MGKKNDTLTDFDKQLIAGMEEVIAHINSEPNKGRVTLVEFANAKSIREGLGMSQAVFCRAYGIPLKTLQHWEQGRHHPDRTASAYLWTIEEISRSSPRSPAASPNAAAGRDRVAKNQARGLGNRRQRNDSIEQAAIDGMF